MKILGIETSCDETAAAVVEKTQDGMLLLSSIVASSVDLHAAYGGVVPEIAARSHLEHINPVIDKSLKSARVSWKDIDAVAVTQGPGLGGSLLIGVLAARTIAILKRKPLYAVNHVLAHPFATFITSSTLPGYELPSKRPDFPFLALIVSGGHTQLVLFENHHKYKVLGRTLDDAVGEAFDKAAKILGLPYPGGPSIAKAASVGDPQKYKLPKAKLDNKYDFSFSGLKTAVLRTAQAAIGQDFSFPSHKIASSLTKKQLADMSASFQRVAAETLVEKTALAAHETQPKSLVIAGGVAASSELRRQIKNAIKIPVFFPDIKLCTDNAAMIAARAAFQISIQHPADPYALETMPNLRS